MKNLAGNPNCDQYIQEELSRCGIEVISVSRSRGEVSSTIEGKLGDFKFTRAWYYWIVEGKMPLEKARELFATEVGKTDIRACGHCGCPPPHQWVTRFHDGKTVTSQEEFDKVMSYGADFVKMFQQKYCTHPDPESLPAFVTSYHIDSELGLYLFAQAVKSL